MFLGKQFRPLSKRFGDGLEISKENIYNHLHRKIFQILKQVIKPVIQDNETISNEVHKSLRWEYEKRDIFSMRW